MMSNSLALYRTTGDDTLHLNITNELIEIRSEAGSRKIMHGKITSLVETKDYIILLTGKLPLFCMPKK